MRTDGRTLEPSGESWAMPRSLMVAFSRRAYSKSTLCVGRGCGDDGQASQPTGAPMESSKQQQQQQVVRW